MFRYNSIRVKLLVLVLAVLVPLVFSRVVNIINYYDNQVKGELVSYENLAEAISTTFTNYIEELWIIEDIVGTYIKDHPDLSMDEMNVYLQCIKQKREGIIRISWLSPEGIIRNSSDEKLLLIDLSSSSYVQEISRGKERVVTDLIESAISPYQSIVAVACAIKEEGHLVGMVSAILDIDKLDQRLPSLKSNPDNHYLLIDSKGMLVYSSETKKTPDDRTSLINDPAVIKTLQGEMSAGVRAWSSLKNAPIMSVDYPISEIGWDCKVFSPYHLAMASHYRQLRNDIFILAFVTLLSLIMVVILGRNFLKPVSALRMATKKIMEGDYSARTSIEGHDEMGLAAEAFDKMAESIEQWNKVKTQFFTNMSHELKTPLNIIFASVQLIENYKTTLDGNFYHAKVSSQMKIIRQNCYRIMRLIANLMDISCYDSGFLKIKPDNFDIVKLTQKITLSVQPYVEAKGLKITFESDLKFKNMACDPDMIERILLNLISNAIKFTDKNGTITVIVKESNNNALLIVKDSGIGIPQDKLKLIFERFSQVNDSYCRNKEGSGIGLSLVKALVEAHGGTVSVTSEILKGTAFSILLPIRILDKSLPTAEQYLLNYEKKPVITGGVSRINIEFSDIYSDYDEDISC